MFASQNKIWEKWEYLRIEEKPWWFSYSHCTEKQVFQGENVNEAQLKAPIAFLSANTDRFLRTSPKIGALDHFGYLDYHV